jgi:hypothetical protein
LNKFWTFSHSICSWTCSCTVQIRLVQVLFKFRPEIWTCSWTIHEHCSCSWTCSQKKKTTRKIWTCSWPVHKHVNKGFSPTCPWTKIWIEITGHLLGNVWNWSEYLVLVRSVLVHNP